MEKGKADFKMEGDAGQNNTFIKIETAYNVNPNATKVENTFIIGSGREASVVLKEALGDRFQETIETTPIRTEILNYVSRVRPLLVDEIKSDFMKLWEDILSLSEVKSKVYHPGKQKGTNFNRDLVANVLFHLRKRKIYNNGYKQDYNGAALAMALEGDKDHSVKHALRNDPPQEIRDAVDAILKTKYY